MNQTDNFDTLVTMLQEFDYEKNGKDLTIKFLITVLYELNGLK